ncbi:MAG: hypothetical protein ABIN18_14445 [Pseudomonadota bacterium]
MPKTNIKVKLVGEDGNAFNLLGRVSKALKRAGHKQLAKEFLQEAVKNDYSHLLATCCDYVEVH